MDIASIVPINIGRGWGEGSHQLARPFGQGGWSCPAPSPQPSPARGEGARSPFDQGRYCYFNRIAPRARSMAACTSWSTLITAIFSTVAIDQSSVFGLASTLGGTRRSQPDAESTTGAGC